MTIRKQALASLTILPLIPSITAFPLWHKRAVPTESNASADEASSKHEASPKNESKTTASPSKDPQWLNDTSQSVTAFPPAPKKTPSTSSSPSPTSRASSTSSASSTSPTSFASSPKSRAPSTPAISPSSTTPTSISASPSSSLSPETEKAGSQNGGGLSGGAIGAIVAVIVIVLLGILAFIFIRRRQSKKLQEGRAARPMSSVSSSGYHGAFSAAAAGSAAQPNVAVAITTPVEEDKAATEIWKQPPLGTYTVVSTYTPTLSDEIVIHVGDQVQIYEEYDDGWCLGANLSRHGERGVFPKHCVLPPTPQMIPLPPSTSSLAISSDDKSKHSRLSSLYTEAPH
ncbi:uncharacterized protein BYT42DRAFT_562177 [Radiomyces spectabilis]|uniref:uncharacterized protein n=1 Tax=Radiomyces spectabilis TaxID=64574 RepID=UPI00221FBCB8|nr:uncharacterized protein BYT42DRAFT_562177 [Radiomyces spectabilis]KAI8384340.1 hypothetical protein BYT42DRAFT_562177 [Radiomyces spectabilis]